MDKQKNKSSLFIYAIALFAVAAALIFLSYLNSEQHNRQEEFDAVTAKQADFSISALQKIEDLQKENEELKQRIEEFDAATAQQAEFSISTMQNIENLQKENVELRQRIKDLEEGREAAVPASGQQ